MSNRPAIVTSCLAALALVALLTVLAMPGESQQRTATSPAGVGRYTIIINPNVRADTYLVDTETGRVWRPVQFTDLPEQPVVWKLMERFDDQAALDEWIMAQP